jgi:hypothetical protein
LRVSKDGVLRRIFGLKMEEVVRDWRRLHNGELHNVYTSPNVVRVIKSRRMRWVENGARMGEKWSDILEVRDHSEGLCVDGRIILERILGK